MTKVLIVDDSALMRKCLREICESTGKFEIVTARNGRDALSQIDAHDPDVVTLDVNMPEMDGLTCLSEIMAKAPRPVVMVSSITSRGAQVTLEALEYGAVDFVEKPGGTVSLNIDSIAAMIVRKIEAAARAKPRLARTTAQRVRRPAQPRPSVRPSTEREGATGAVLVGVSTGGPRTLEDILPELPSDLPCPVVVAQHMPGAFTGSFAARLDRICDLHVVEVTGPMPLRNGHIYIGRGDADVIIDTRLGRTIVNSVAQDEQYLWHPSVERLVRTAMRTLNPERLVAVQLTGMGNDGAEAMTELRKAGGRTIAEHESTAIVNGMPAELIRLGGAQLVLPSTNIAKQLTCWLR
jgi:two-component system, chemotaxis family, protein-glutamate methylesterase/glutaminase